MQARRLVSACNSSWYKPVSLRRVSTRGKTNWKSWTYSLLLKPSSSSSFSNLKKLGLKLKRMNCNSMHLTERKKKGREKYPVTIAETRFVWAGCIFSRPFFQLSDWWKRRRWVFCATCNNARIRGDLCEIIFSPSVPVPLSSSSFIVLFIHAPLPSRP